MRLTYHPGADKDLAEAVRFYKRGGPAVGRRFLDEVKRALKEILEAPEGRRRVVADVHRYHLDRFPYAIHYRVLPDRVRVMAFAHDRRRPSYWQERLTD